MRIIARMFEQNGTIFIGAAIAVVILIALVILSRRMRKKATSSGGAVAAPGSAPMPENDIELSMMEDPMPTGNNEAMQFELDETPPDQLDDAAAHQFDIDDDGLDDIDDITIPKVGEAPAPRKSRFFSASWLHRDKKETPVFAPGEMAAPDARTMDSAAECARLAEIERNMLALRELYEAGLIAPEVYVLKAREFAAQSA